MIFVLLHFPTELEWNNLTTELRDIKQPAEYETKLPSNLKRKTGVCTDSLAKRGQEKAFVIF